MGCTRVLTRCRRSGRISRLLTALSLLTVILFGTGSGVASAEPSADDVQQKLDKLHEKVDEIVEQYNQAQLKLDDVQQRLTSLKERIAEQEKRVSRMRAEMGAIAAEAYRSGGINAVTALLGAGDAESFISRAATLGALVRDRQARLRDFQAKVARLRHQQLAVQRAVEKKARIEEKLDKRKETIQAKIDEKQELLEEVQEPAAGAGVDVNATYTGPASGPARVAVEFAYAQLGKPYVWGADGPDAYDCSGLTMAAWAQAGVSLPHSSTAQFSAGPHVSKSGLQAGDLVFFGVPTIHHVGIYVGGGQMIHAPHSGTVVQIDPIESGWFAEEYVGAVRP